MGRNEEGRKEERRTKKKKRAVCERTQNFLPPSSKRGTLREATLQCTAAHPSDTVAVFLQSTAILHISNMHVVCGRPVETCKYYTLSVSHFLSSIPPSLPQLQLAYFNSAGKKEEREGGREAGAQTRSCRAASLREDAPRHTAQQCQASCVASRRLVKKTAAQRRRKEEEEGEPKLLSIFPEKMMLHITALARSDPTRPGARIMAVQPFKIPRRRNES